jgi:hypothetical protein
MSPGARGAASRRHFLSVAVAALALLMPGPAAAGEPQSAGVAQAPPMALADAVQVLAREQSVAEQYAVILDRLGRNDPSRYVQGIVRYTDAKADFDGLIEALKTDLIEDRDLASSAKFADALHAAAEKRVAFTAFVTNEIVGANAGARGSLPIVPGLPDLITGLTKAGISIWREYRAAGKEKRDEIRDELDHLKWKSFADIAKR